MKLTLLAIATLMVSLLAAQQINTRLALTDVVSGRPVEFTDFGNQPGLVLIFTGNECPFDAHYRERLRSLVQHYEGKISFLLINAYTEHDERPEAMKAAFGSWQFTTPYLADKDQVALAAFDVRRSPEAVVVTQTGGKFTVFYRGAIDDSPQAAEDVGSYFLKNAIEALLNGTPAPANRPAVGCTIRRK